MSAGVVRVVLWLILLAILAASPVAAQTSAEERAVLRAAAALLARLGAEPVSPTIRITAAAQLQPALDAAAPGDTLEVAAGTYVGTWTFPAKTGRVTVRGVPSTGVGATLTPTTELRSPSSLPAAQVGSSWVLEDLTFSAAVPNGDLVRIGTSTHTAAQVPTDITFTRVYFKGDPVRGQKRGLAANGAHVTVTHSRCTDIKLAGQDTQCVVAWNGPGPFTITHNHFEAAGENIMFGGSDPSIPNLVPCDILVAHNTLTKPLAWRGTTWAVKNLFELKSACRVVVRDNLFEHNWLQGQTGYAVVLKSTNQDGQCAWCQTREVVFERNILRNVSSGFSLAGRPEAHPAIPMSRITVRHNLIVTNSAQLKGDGRCVMVNGVADVTLEYNTCQNDGSSAIYFGESGVNRNFVLRGNILVDRCAGDCWGIMGSGSGEGFGALRMWAPDAIFERNLIVTPTPWLYGPASQNRLEATMPADTTGYGRRP